MANVKNIQIDASVTDAFAFSYGGDGTLDRYMPENLPGSHDPVARQAALNSIASWTMSPLGGLQFDWTPGTAHVASERFQCRIWGTEAINSKAVHHLMRCLVTLGFEIHSVHEYDIENREGGNYTDAYIAEILAREDA